MFFLNLIAPFRKYIIAGGLVFLLCLFCTVAYNYKLDARYKEGVLVGKSQCELTQKDQQINTQSDTIKTIQKARIISKNNASLERDELIDKL